MWTAENRGRYDRSKLRYPSDLTDDEWTHVEPLIPPAKGGGNKRHVDVREVMNGIMYILRTGCQWRAVPKDLPPRSTLFDYLDLWSYDGTLDRIHHALYMECREQAEREASPTAAIPTPHSIPPRNGAAPKAKRVKRVCIRNRSNHGSALNIVPTPARNCANLASCWGPYYLGGDGADREVWPAGHNSSENWLPHRLPLSLRQARC
jgi:transposase